MRTHALLAAIVGATLGNVGCAGEANVEDETVEAESASEIKIGYAGMNHTQFGNSAFGELFSSTSGATHARSCHGYAPWEIAYDAYRNAEPGMVSLFDGWYAHATAGGADHCGQLMVSFKAWRNNDGVGGDERYPRDPAEFKTAFLAFRKRYPAVTLFTTWNEVNNRSASESGLFAEDAAKLYLALRSVCHPSQGCLVAAGSFLGWNEFNVDDFQIKCGLPDEGCANGSYLDRFKYYVRQNSAHFGLGNEFFPEFVAYHPWWDSFQYSQHHMHCDSPSTCVTRAILHNLGGKWGRSLLWANEVGADQKDSNGREDDDLQACTVSYLQRVFALSSRITRFYYFDFCGITKGQKSNCGASAPGPALTVLRNRDRNYRSSGHGCP